MTTLTAPELHGSLTLTAQRDYYQPFRYPQAFEFYKAQEAMHWTVEETPIGEDKMDWDFRLDNDTKNVYASVLQWFTQQDVNVASGYYDCILRWYTQPELRMMYGHVARTEGLHVDAYSTIPEQLGLPDTDYAGFLKIKETADKHEYYTQRVEGATAEERCTFLIRNGVFGEGVSLYGLFTILMNAQRFGHMKNLGQMITWSARDEDVHVTINLWTFKTELEENPEVWNKEFKAKIYDMAREVTAMEKAYVREALRHGKLPDLSLEDLEKFIEFLVDWRLTQIGLKPIHGVAENPLKWMDWVFSNSELTNFFENRSAAYATGMLQGEWKDSYPPSTEEWATLELMYSKNTI